MGHIKRGPGDIMPLGTGGAKLFVLMVPVSQLPLLMTPLTDKPVSLRPSVAASEPVPFRIQINK